MLLAQWDSIIFWDPSTSLIQIITAMAWGQYFVVEHNQNHEGIIIIHKMYSERHHETAQLTKINSVVLVGTKGSSVQ